MTIVILTEKPSQMRNMAHHFKARTNADGFLQGSRNGQDVIVVSAVGHIYSYDTKRLDKMLPQGKAERYTSWAVSNLPWDMQDFDWTALTLNKGMSKVVTALKKAFSKSSEIVIATDVDITGEGQLLAYEVIDNLGFGRHKLSRLYFSDETDGADVLKGFDERKPLTSSDRDPEYQMAAMRQRFDFGTMQFTRLATKLGDGQTLLNQGALKTAIVRRIAEQEDAVKAYKKVPMYSLRFKDANGNVFATAEPVTYATPNQVVLPASDSIVVDGTTRKKTVPPTLLTTSVLTGELEAAGYKSDEVIATYQKLYEKGIVSYPRTADAFVTPDQFDKLLPLVDKIANVAGIDTKHLTRRTPRPTHVKTGGVHGANRPGLSVPNSLDELTQYGKSAQAIYVHLARNYLATLCGDYEYDQTKAHLEKNPSYTSTVNEPKAFGWRAVYKDLSSEDDVAIAQAKPFGLTADPFVYEGFPPKPSSPTSKWLYRSLAKAGNVVDNELVGRYLAAYEKLLADNKVKSFDIGVGTGATQVSAYNELIKLDMVKAVKGKLSLTEKGRMAYMMSKGTTIASLALRRLNYAQMCAIKAGLTTVDKALGCLAEFVKADREIMTNNGAEMRRTMNLEMRPDVVEVERFEMVFEGEVVSPKREWGGHRFTDEEVEALSRGEVISFKAVSKSTGKMVTYYGAIGKGEYNGRPFYGFQPDFSYAPPSSWCGYTFTEAEIETLQNGGSVHYDKFRSKAGKEFAATLTFGVKEDGKKGIIPAFN